jgi:hypothetical protein
LKKLKIIDCISRSIFFMNRTIQNMTPNKSKKRSRNLPNQSKNTIGLHNYATLNLVWAFGLPEFFGSGFSGFWGIRVFENATRNQVFKS